MPSPLKKCAECDSLTHGLLCKPCETKRRTKHYCKKTYQRFWQSKKKYGVDESGFEVLWIAFKGKCGICSNDLALPRKGRGQQLDVVAIDHDHASGNIRGLLCHACNRGLGYFKDNPESLINAAKWVKNHEKNGDCATS